MKTIQDLNNNNLIYINDNSSIKTIFDKGMIWLTKKELANIYGIKKSEIKKELKIILKKSKFNSFKNKKRVYNDIKNKIETYYSLDILLLLGYKSKHFKETKYLININNIIKEYSKTRKHNNK